MTNLPLERVTYFLKASVASSVPLIIEEFLPWCQLRLDQVLNDEREECVLPSLYFLQKWGWCHWSLCLQLGNLSICSWTYAITRCNCLTSLLLLLMLLQNVTVNLWWKRMSKLNPEFFLLFVLQTYFVRDQRSGGKKWQGSCEVFVVFAVCTHLWITTWTWIASEFILSAESICVLLFCSVLTKCYLVWRWAC